jgi:hypothetical protein
MTKVYPVRKLAGAVMMFVGGVPLAVILVLLLVVPVAFTVDVLPIGAQFMLSALLVAACYWMWRRSRRVLAVFLAVFGVLFFWSGLEHWVGRNQLADYGVSYESDGERESYQATWFYLNRNGERIPCVEIDGDVSVRFRRVDGEKMPDIVVRGSESDYAVLRLNLKDPTKPVFKLLENHKMLIAYAHPWEDFYHSPPSEYKTTYSELLPTPR